MCKLNRIDSSQSFFLKDIFEAKTNNKETWIDRLLLYTHTMKENGVVLPRAHRVKHFVSIDGAS